MGKSRTSAFVFAAAYIALIVGLFLALGGAAYAQSPASAASDQYDDKVEGRAGLGNCGRRYRRRCCRGRCASEHRSFASRSRRRRRRTRRRRARPAAARAAQELARRSRASLARQPLFEGVEFMHPPVGGGSLGSARHLCEAQPRHPVAAGPSRLHRGTARTRLADGPRGRRRRHRARDRARTTRRGELVRGARARAPQPSPARATASRPREERLVADETPHRGDAEGDGAPISADDTHRHRERPGAPRSAAISADSAGEQAPSS